MSDDPKPLTRKELAEFLPSMRAIKAFEKLFDLVPSSINDLEINVNDAGGKAAQALSLLESIAQSLELLANAPVIQSYVDEDDFHAASELISEDLIHINHEQITDSNDLTPRLEVGTISSQNSDSVEITGGTITANITNNQTILLATSVALTDNAAASAATLLNSPVVGNPSKWVAINDNGTTRYIPTW